MQEQGRRCQSAANQMLAMAYEDSINGGARIGSSADRGLIGLYRSLAPNGSNTTSSRQGKGNDKGRQKETCSTCVRHTHFSRVIFFFPFFLPPLVVLLVSSAKHCPLHGLWKRRCLTMSPLLSTAAGTNTA